MSKLNALNRFTKPSYIITALGLIVASYASAAESQKDLANLKQGQAQIIEPIRDGLKSENDTLTQEEGIKFLDSITVAKGVPGSRVMDDGTVSTDYSIGKVILNGEGDHMQGLSKITSTKGGKTVSNKLTLTIMSQKGAILAHYAIDLADNELGVTNWGLKSVEQQIKDFPKWVMEIKEALK